MGAIDWEYFEIEGYHYLAVANHHNNTTGTINSIIYRWNNSIRQFEFYQAIRTNWAYDWEFFTIGDNFFLVVANNRNATSYNIDSVLYNW